MYWLRWHYHIKDIAGALYKIKKKRKANKTTESPTVSSRGQTTVILCSHCQTTTGKVKSSAHDGTSSATVHSRQTTAGCSMHMPKPLGRHGHRVLNVIMLLDSHPPSDAPLGWYAGFKYKIYSNINTASCSTLDQTTAVVNLAWPWPNVVSPPVLSTVIDGVRHSEPVVHNVCCVDANVEPMAGQLLAMGYSCFLSLEVRRKNSGCCNHEGSEMSWDDMQFDIAVNNSVVDDLTR